MNARNRPMRWRTAAVLAVGLALGIAMTATPAAGHVTGSARHLARHMKTTFFTKAQSEARYVNVGEKAASAAQADNAANADSLDGNDSTAFLRNDAAAGGDLTGAYPNPTVAPDSITGADIQNGTITSADVAPNTFMRSAVYGRNAETYGSIDGDVPPPGDCEEIYCRATVACDPGDIALNGGFIAIDPGTHLQDAAVLSSALTVAGVPNRFFAGWRNDDRNTPELMNIVVWCVNM